MLAQMADKKQPEKCVAVLLFVAPSPLHGMAVLSCGHSHFNPLFNTSVRCMQYTQTHARVLAFK